MVVLKATFLTRLSRAVAVAQVRVQLHLPARTMVDELLVLEMAVVLLLLEGWDPVPLLTVVMADVHPLGALAVQAEHPPGVDLEIRLLHGEVPAPRLPHGVVQAPEHQHGHHRAVVLLHGAETEKVVVPLRDAMIPLERQVLLLGTILPRLQLLVYGMLLRPG